MILVNVGWERSSKGEVEDTVIVRYCVVHYFSGKIKGGRGGETVKVRVLT
jgi:hypothetical protein